MRKGSAECLEDGHLKPQVAARGGYFGSDKAASDYADARSLLQILPDSYGVVQSAQDVDPWEVGATFNPPGRGASGDHQTIEADGFAIGHDYGARVEVKRDGPLSELPLDIEFGMAGLVPEERVIRSPLTSKDLFGQGRSVVRPEFLFAYHDHFAVIALLP